MNQETDTKLTRDQLREQLEQLKAHADTLKAVPLQRNPDFQGKQVEAIAVAQDNALLSKHPEMTQNLSREETESLAALGQALPGIVLPAQPAATPGAVLPSTAPIAAPPSTAFPPETTPKFRGVINRIVLTGSSGVGKSFIAAQVSGARVVELTDPLDALLRELCPGLTEGDTAGVAATLFAWGNGVLSEKYPLSPARLMFADWIRGKGWEGFGQPNYWLNRLLEGVGQDDFVVITRVELPTDLKALIDLGFRHYHVIASGTTLGGRKQRAGADNRLANALNQDVIRKLSAQRQGERLRAIWNDSVPAPSQRVFTVAQWLSEVNANQEAIPQLGE